MDSKNVQNHTKNEYLDFALTIYSAGYGLLGSVHEEKYLVSKYPNSRNRIPVSSLHR